MLEQRWRQRDRAVSAIFADHVLEVDRVVDAAAVDHDVSAAQPDDLHGPQSGLDREQHHETVTPKPVMNNPG